MLDIKPFCQILNDRILLEGDKTNWWGEGNLSPPVAGFSERQRHSLRVAEFRAAYIQIIGSVTRFYIFKKRWYFDVLPLLC
jgi:hypothetical protein